MEKVAMNGDQVIALAWKQIDPDVVAAYPITPQTIIVEAFSEYVADGLVNTEYVCAESEHSAMSMCIGASASGARTATATASAGLAFMWEMLYIASGMRLPIVMAVANRALSGPINIHCDHSDAMGARDSGWIQIFGENVQEAYDNSIMAFRIAEHMDLRLPTMTCLDGFIVTHSLERFEPLPDEVVKKFVGPFKYKRSLLDVKNPTTFGPFDWTDFYFEHKYQQVDAMRHVIPVMEQVQDDFAKVSGRRYNIIEPYRLDDADYAVVAMGSTAGTLKDIVDELRAEGKKVGSIKLRLFRPFPAQELAKILQGLKGVAILDRAVSIGASGPLFPEVRSALYDAKDRPKLKNYIYGLGGRDIKPEELKHVYKQLIYNEGELVNFLGVRA
ncbi:MAG: pyruvate ferredoxin oxidoreductase [Methanomassiliicoccales archaeon]|nr:pyruvate ferredoxin oxidoreductase [Methanomassiliicoccales archaeon]MDD1756299.1 pyruvate ferredoxin oxidoreductase [Methanomassiliicoccales archaeon]